MSVTDINAVHQGAPIHRYHSGSVSMLSRVVSVTAIAYNEP